MLLAELELQEAADEIESEEGRVTWLQGEVRFDEQSVVDSVLPCDEELSEEDEAEGEKRGRIVKPTPKVIRKLKDKVAPREQWLEELRLLNVGFHSVPDVAKISKLVDRYYLENDKLDDCYSWQKEKLLLQRERNKQELFRQLWQLRNQLYVSNVGLSAYFEDGALLSSSGGASNVLPVLDSTA